MYISFKTKGKKEILLNFDRAHFVAQGDGKDEYKIVTDYMDFLIDKKTFEKVKSELIKNFESEEKDESKK